MYLNDISDISEKKRLYVFILMCMSTLNFSQEMFNDIEYKYNIDEKF